MAVRISATLIAGGLSIAACLPFFPLTSSPAPQQSAVPLKDVCPEGWSRYRCQGDLIRLCVAPDVESQHNLRDSFYFSSACRADESVVPEAWAHARAQEIGYNVAAGIEGYNFRSRVARLDSSQIKNGDMEKTIEKILRDYPHGREEGFDELGPLGRASLDDYGLHLPPKPSVREVCPAAWGRYSCQFVRLCVAPSVANRYNLETSKEFGYAECNADNHSVGEEDTNSSPHDVGMAAGALLLGPRYVGVVKLDSSDIVDGNLDEAIERLVLVPIPTNALIEYQRGLLEGRAEFERYLAKAKQKAKEIEDAKSPH
jgi:hypothetical protein